MYVKDLLSFQISVMQLYNGVFGYGMEKGKILIFCRDYFFL